jgi:carbamoyltransferase
MHDSSACIVRDGELLFAIAEERLSRQKHDGRFPALAIRACLDFAGISAADLDFVCFGWPRPRAGFQHDLFCYALGKQPLTYRGLLNSARGFLSMQHQRGGQNRFRHTFGNVRSRMRFVDHHLAHAISAYAFSGFEDSAVLVVDGRGAWEATSIWHGKNGRLRHVQTISWPNSLGMFYAQFTQYLGFQPWSDEWKVMGLAPYGKPGVDLREFIVVDERSYRVNLRHIGGNSTSPTAEIEKRLGPRRAPESEVSDHHKNIAFAVQDACEHAMLTLARRAIAETHSQNLCIAGGVALNAKANGKILSSGIANQLFIQPAAGDDGASLGAALAPYLDNGWPLPLSPLRSIRTGPNFSNEEIECVVNTYKLRYARSHDIASQTADLLSNGKIVGWFQGRMEFGPRALGGRSILADPRDPQMKEKVNRAVKFRESWRPFAPSLRAESAGDYLESATDSPFMILTAQVKSEKRNVIPAVTHVDGSTRPQIVEKDADPIYWNLINEFGKRTGVPVVMNTSFNLRGEPIVCTPTDAIRTFFSSGMDALAIGDFIVEK